MSNEVSTTLQAQGYTGATAGTPYKPTTEEQRQTLQELYNRSFTGQVQSPPSSQAVHLNVNFDGTQNSEFTVPGESRTNVWQLQDLQKKATMDGIDNTIYERGIGAQTVPTGTLDANGNPEPGSITSNWESTPWKAGEIGQEILLRAYKRLEARVQAILAENPNAEIALNLSGFSRGSAEAVAFANLLNERGIEGLYKPGEVPIHSMVLYDPVNQTAGVLDTTWPANVKNALVIVAMNEGRAIMPAMPVGANAIIVGVPGAHANIGGSFNEQGIQAVTLKLAHDFLQASGVPMADIPANLQPDWSQMVVHNSALDNHGNRKWDYTDGNRYYESGGLGSISVQNYVGQKFQLDPIYVKVDGKYEFTGFNKTISTDTTDPETGIRSTSKDTTLLDKGARVLSRSFESNSSDSTGQMIAVLNVTYAADGLNILKTTLTERQPDNSMLQTVRNGQGNTLTQTHTQTFNDGSGLSETRNALGQVVSSSTTHVQEQANGQTTRVTETVNHLATGVEVASVKELVTSGGARIVNSTTADGHISEETWATVGGQQTLQSSKVLSYSQAERDVAASDVALAGLELTQALRSGNKLQAAGSLIRLVNQAQVASNTQPVLGAIGTGFSGAVSILSALDSWGDASDGERIALTARAVLGANEVAKAFSADGNTGFLQSSAALGALQGVVALASLDDVLESGNPFAIASTFMALTNAAVATGMVTSATAAGALGTSAFSSAAVFGPQAMIAVAICSIIFGGLFGDDPEYPAPPPAGTAELGYLDDGRVGLLFKGGDGHLYQTRSLDGQVVWQETQTLSEDRGHWANIDYGDSSQSHWVSDMRYWDAPLNQVRDNQDFGLGASVLSERLSSLIADLQAQVGKDGQHLLLERLPSVSVHGYPSFDGNGVNNFFFALKFNNAVSGGEQMLATAHQDLAAQFKEVASYAGALVGETEWALIQAKQVAGNTYATETEGQYVDRQSGDKAGDSLQSAEQAKAQADNNRQTYSLLTLDLEGDGIAKRAKAEAGMDLDSIKADTTSGTTRLDVDNDGYMELTEWVGSKEAILGIDRNGDGQLSAATELLTGGELSDAAENLGLKRLAFFDANADGKLDKLDAYFNSFKLWLDINGDARTGVGEVYSLTDAGIQSISVNTGAVSFADGQTLTLQKTQLAADVRGVSVSAVSDGKDGVLAGQYMVRQEGKEEELNLTADAAEDLSDILKLVKPGQDVSAAEKQRLSELAAKYGVDLSNPAALLGLGGGGNMAGSPTETSATAGDVFTLDQAPNADEVKAALRAYFEQVSINPDAGPALAHRVLSAQEDSALSIRAEDLIGGLVGVTLVSVQDARRGTVSLNAQGQVVFTPQANEHGTAYFTYTAQDAQGKTSTAMVWLNVASVNDAPAASADEFSLQEDNSLTLTAAQLLANDADADITTDAAEALRITAVDSAVHGQVRLADGQVVFTPDANYHGTASFRYTLSDAAGASHPATVHLKVDGVNDAPVLLQALPLQRVDEDQRLMVAAADLLASVQDVDAATDGQSLLVSEVTDVSHGSAQIDTDGNLWFAPDADFNGTATLRYWIKDNLGASVGVWASVTVTAINDAPELVEALAQKTLDEDRTMLLTAASLLATVRDADVATNADVLRVERVSDVSHGQASVDAEGNVLYTPDANFNGQAVLRYWVTDKAGASVGVWTSFKVTAVNDGPVAVNDSLSVLEDNTLTLSAAQLLANDTDADLLDAAGDTLTVTAVGQANHGTVSLNNGVVTFTADADWQGAASFQYTVVDAAGASSEGTAHVTVIGVNDAPVLTNKQDKILAKEDTLLRVETATLLAYARDVDQSFGDVLKVTAVAGATKGVASLQADGSVLFKPNANANGDAVLTYQVTDLQGRSVLVAVTINIDAVNDAPIARLDAYDQAKEDTTIRIAQSVFINNDSDVDWTTGQMDVLRVTDVSQVQGGGGLYRQRRHGGLYPHSRFQRSSQLGLYLE